VKGTGNSLVQNWLSIPTLTLCRIERHSLMITSPPGWVWSIVVSISVHSHNLRKTWPNFTRIYVHFFAAVLRSSSDGVTICYVFPVSWMTSCFHTTGFMTTRAARVYNRRNYSIISNRSASTHRGCMLKWNLLCKIALLLDENWMKSSVLSITLIYKEQSVL